MKGRGLLVGLLVSLALNLFLVGLGVGAWALGPRLVQPAPVVAQGGGRAILPLWAMGRALSPQHRPAFNAVLREALAAGRGDIREAREIRRRAFDSMASDAFDAVKVSADLDRARDLEVGARARLERDIVSFSATLPPEERARLAEAMRAIAARRVGARLQRQGATGPQGEAASDPLNAVAGPGSGRVGE